MITLTVAELAGCCAAPAWAGAVAAGGPYRDLDGLIAAAERLWWDQPPDEWRAALAAHPRIGERVDQSSREALEQGRVSEASAAELDDLAALNRAYESQFGMTYVVRATGRTAAEMLDLLRTRLANDPDVELRVAAEQQWEITVLRLQALVEVEAR